MSRVVSVTSLTLDGVMQAPGRPDEDRRGGFEHGGWALPYNDPVMARAMGEGMARGGSLVLGRRTYEDFYDVWPGRTDNPFTEVLDKRQKYVASTTLPEPLAWINSTLLKGDAADALAELKQTLDGDLAILGSGNLVQSLVPRNLIDEYLLLIHPLIVGGGRRFFPEGTFVSLRLLDAVTTTTGVVIARYQPVTA